jgi:capsular polysaccharide biosynthesis protein
VLRDARLVWSDCFVLEDGLFRCSFAETDQFYAWALAVRDAGSVAQRAAAITPEDDRYYIDDSKLSELEDIDEPTMFASIQEPHDWGMFLLNAMPAVAHFIANRASFGKLFIYLHQPNMRAMAALLGLAREDIQTHDVFRAYRFREIHLLRQSTMDCFIDPTQQALFSGLRDRAVARYNGPRAPRVFIAPPGSARESAPANLIDEAALAAGLAALGFIILQADKLPAIGQIQVFAQAEIVVGLAGASMFNTIFCKPGTQVVSIETVPSQVQRHANLYASLGLDYCILVGNADETDPRLLQRPWRIDAEAALRQIRIFCQI